MGRAFAGAHERSFARIVIAKQNICDRGSAFVSGIRCEDDPRDFVRDPTDHTGTSFGENEHDRFAGGDYFLGKVELNLRQCQIRNTARMLGVRSFSET